MKINILKKCAIISLLAVLFCGSLTGCQQDHPDPVNIAFVAGIADGETHFNTDIEELQALPATPGSNYAFVAVESSTVTIAEGQIPDLSDKGYTKKMLNRLYEGFRAELTDCITSYHPASPEIDIAAATERAVRHLNAHIVEGRKNILVFYCSGRSTSGLINMLETPISMLDVENSVSTISENMNLDMSNVDEVIFYCCGDVGGDQPALSSNEKKILKDFYNQLFTACGAKAVTFRDDLPSDACYDFPNAPVSNIEAEGTVSGLTELKDSGRLVIKKQLHKADSPEFLDADMAAETLQPVVEFLTESPSKKILVYGTTAGDTDTDFSLWLSRARAESVKNLLVEAGIDERRIQTVTIRVADDPEYQFGLGTGAEGAVNRKTVIVDADSDFAKNIIANAV